MKINEEFIMLIMAGAGLLIVLALCMAALYKWITFLNGKMIGYGTQVHQLLNLNEKYDVKKKTNSDRSKNSLT